MGAAHGKQRPESPLRAEGLEAIAPLHRALVVVDALTGGNQVAAGEADQHPIAHFARQHRGVDLVQLLKAFGDAAGGHARKAVQRASDHFVVHRPERLSNPHGFGCEFFRLVRVSIVEQREDAAPQRKPGMFCRIRTALEEPMGPLEPPVRNRLLAPERRRIPGEPDGHPRRSQAVVAFTIEAIRAFADVEHDVGHVEPPGGEPQTFECRGIFPGLERFFERETGRLPVATTKRRLAGIEPVDAFDGVDGSMGLDARAISLSGKDYAPRTHAGANKDRWASRRSRRRAWRPVRT